jgi:2,3-diaminopropionate biosynthesis protein SbnB
MRSDRDLLVLCGNEIAHLLEGTDERVIKGIAEAYKAHGLGATSLPHSAFVSLPGESNRIIALPAYLGGTAPTAGMKWIASVPGNIQRGVDRASAVIVLNDVDTGRPTALLEGSRISARRTAASAILATRLLEPNPSDLSLVGCGFVNYEIARMAVASCSSLRRLVLFDVKPERAAGLASLLSRIEGIDEVRITGRIEEACDSCQLVSFATTASRPHIYELRAFQAGATILHISLRDISPEIILSSDNIVDDVEHVCRANTSIHLAEKLVAGRQFIRCSLGEILLKRVPPRKDRNTRVIFSPFGLGILDIAIARIVFDEALRRGFGTTIPAFLSRPWNEQEGGSSY